MRAYNRKSAFTPLELVAFIAITGILVSFIMHYGGGLINSVKSFKVKYPGLSDSYIDPDKLIPGKPSEPPAMSGVSFSLDSLADGKNVFTNRSYTITDLDSRFEGAYFYRTPNEVTTNPTIIFTVPTTVYVLVNTKPTENSGFSEFTEFDILNTTDVPFDNQQFYKAFQPGTYQLFDPLDVPYKAIYIIN